MNSYLKSISCSLLIICSVSICFAQGFNETSLLLEKQIFKAKNDSLKSEFLLKKSIFYLKHDSIDLAISCAIKAFNFHKSSKALVSLIQFSLLNDYAKMLAPILENQIINLNIEMLDNKTIKYIAIYYLNKLQFAKSDYFIQVLENRNFLEKRFLSDTLNIKQKNVKLAKRLNMVFPGIGLLYAGKRGVGVLNIIFVSAGVYFTIHHLQNKNFFSAIFTGLSFTTRVYIGGISYSAKSTYEFNVKMKMQYCQNKITFLQQIED